MEWVFAVVIVILIGSFVVVYRARSYAETLLADMRVAHVRDYERLSAAEAESTRLHEKIWHLEQTVEGMQREITARTAAASESRAQLEAERAHANERQVQFRQIASEILQQERKTFTEEGGAALGQLLQPFAQQLEGFKKQVSEGSLNGAKQMAALSQEIKTTCELNQTLAKGAEELARALKGSNKTQGNWGEVVLQNVLEQAGLRRGHEYNAQWSSRHEDGTRGQPDIVIRLPEDRHLVVDSKVSLTAYQDYVRAETDVARDAARKRHVESLRAHIKGLSAKAYPDLYDIRTLDFVLLFVPIEPAFLLAVSDDGALFSEAWDKNILLCSPSTLMFVLRTVASLWRQEQQSKNAQEIAHRGAELYDKLAGFVAELDKVGRTLRQAQTSFDDARAKLATGRGNVIRQAEQLRDLGVKPQRALPAPLVEQAEEDADLLQ